MSSVKFTFLVFLCDVVEGFFVRNGGGSHVSLVFLGVLGLVCWVFAVVGMNAMMIMVLLTETHILIY